MTGWQDVIAGPGGLVGVGAGWGTATAWLVAAAAVAVLVIVGWWLVARSPQRRGRGADLALRRHDLQRTADPEPGVDGRRPRRRRRR